MKNVAYRILIFVFLIFVLIGFACLIFNKDYGYDTKPAQNYEKLKGIDSVLPPQKNVTINGVDYLQTQLPLGKFGGSLTTSIMGDPKTFNPYNANDATSAQLS